MFNRFKSNPVVYERDKKVTLVGETDSEGKIFITGYRKEDSTMGQETPKIDIGSARNLTSPFPVEQANTEVPGAPGPIAEVPVATEAVPAPNDSVSGAEEEPVTEPPSLDLSKPPPAEQTEAEPNTEVPPPAEGSAPDTATTPPPPPPVKPPKPAPMGPVSPLFTEKMNQGGRKSRRNKKTGKKQKGGKLRRKSRKQRK